MSDASRGCDAAEEPTGRWRVAAAFWLMGLLNNSPYVVMNAGAMEIASGGVALVYIANIAPSLLVKLTIPYWGDLMRYRTRIYLASTSMACSFLLVAFGRTLPTQLLGVGFSAVQSGLGEATMLGLTAKYHPFTPLAVTSWSSGTGFAGIFGYAWVVLFRVLGASLQATLLAALSMTVSYILTFTALTQGGELEVPLGAPPARGLRQRPQEQELRGKEGGDAAGPLPVVMGPPPPLADDSEMQCILKPVRSSGCDSASRRSFEFQPINHSFWQRALFVLRLWPYTLPLIVVYFAEYAMQSGTWAVVGFPIQDKASRARFYTFANFTYQAGVFVSRSSGTLLQAGLATLWFMPALQVSLLGFFCVDVMWQFWWDWTLLGPCFLTGLLGGAVYVNAFTLICRDYSVIDEREFALTAASVGDCLGILLSDMCGLLIQGCLFKYHGIPGASYHC